MVKYTDAQGNTQDLDRKEFTELMRTIWEIAQANKEKGDQEGG